MCVSSLFTSDRRRASEAGDALGQALQNAYVAQAHYVGISLYLIALFFLYCSGPFHRERRRYLRTALSELYLLLSDSPGLLGPKVCLHCTYMYMYIECT